MSKTPKKNAGLHGSAAPPPEPTPHVLDVLHGRIESARNGDPATSYTAKLAQRGRAKVAQKVGEEAVEAVIEIVRDDHDAIIGESADLLYHLMVAWAISNVKPEEVWAELARRDGIGGLAEKAARKS